MGFIRTNLLKSIEWTEDSKNCIIYKFPMDGREIQYGSKLVVRESQVAIFMNKGKIADVFGPGTHTLKTSNLPILTQLLALPFGFKSPFVADVFFVNTKQFTAQKWGTSAPISMRDKEFGSIRVRGFGSYAFKVSDPALFLKEVAGTTSNFSTEDVEDFLRSHLVSSISDTIAEAKISALDLASNLGEFSKTAKENAKDAFSELGLQLTKLIIESLSFPEEVQKAIDARTSVGIMGDKMDDFVKYQSAQAVRDIAKNPSGNSAGASVGAGIALGEIIRDSIASKKTVKEIKICPECKSENRKSAKFCSECGKKFSTAKVCPKCESKLPSKAKFCPECGEKI